MKWLNHIRKKYFYGITMKLFIFAKISIAIFILFAIYPNSLTLKINGHPINFIPLLGVILILIMSSVYNRMLAKPLVEINKTVSKIAKLDFSSECKVASADELGELSHNLNFISKKLNSTISKLENELDNNKKLLKLQREFSDSLSHEMKTPLGIIMAYAQGLEDDIDPGKKDMFIKTIIQETKQMDDIIVQLLNLSRMETGVTILEKTRFNIVELVEEVAGRILIDRSDRAFNTICQFKTDKININADKKKIELVLSNFIMNAYKYVENDGYIKIAIHQDGNKVKVEIFNSGKTIPIDKLHKIWERFYRVDRSRDKKTGGSGLGLAISKQILVMHGFEYGVKNAEDGVSFYFIA